MGADKSYNQGKITGDGPLDVQHPSAHIRGAQIRVYTHNYARVCLLDATGKGGTVTAGRRDIVQCGSRAVLGPTIFHRSSSPYGTKLSACQGYLPNIDRAPGGCGRCAFIHADCRACWNRAQTQQVAQSHEGVIAPLFVVDPRATPNHVLAVPADL